MNPDANVALDPATVAELERMQLVLAGQVGAVLMLTLSLVLMIVGVCLVGSRSDRLRRAGFVVFAVNSFAVFCVPAIFTAAVAPVLFFVSIWGYMRAKNPARAAEPAA